MLLVKFQTYLILKLL